MIGAALGWAERPATAGMPGKTLAVRWGSQLANDRCRPVCNEPGQNPTATLAEATAAIQDRYISASARRVDPGASSLGGFTAVRVLVDGDRGYIGSVLVPFLRAAGHEVVGLDVGWYDGCDFGARPDGYEQRTSDIRDVTAEDLEGFDAIIHLAAISNDPIGHFRPDAPPTA